MITIAQVKNAFEKVYDCYDTVDKSSNFIHSHDELYYSDILEYNRNIISELWLSFWIWELFESSDSSTTLVYTWNNNNNIIVFQEWLKEFNTLEEYCDWLNRMEEQALHINK